MNVYEQYRAKLKTPEQAVRVVKSGDWVDYTSNVCYPPLLDAAMSGSCATRGFATTSP